MFIEKWKLQDALEKIPGVHILPSSLWAVEKGSKYPTIAIDYGIYQIAGASEDNVSLDVIPQYTVHLYTRPYPHDERKMEELAYDLHNKVLLAITEAFAGYQFTIYGQPIGIDPFGEGEAYHVSYTLDLGPVAATFKAS